MNTSWPSRAPTALHLRKCCGATGLSALVRAEQRDIEVVARVREVVGVASVERDRELGREDQADVGVLLVAIQVVPSAAIERDDVAALRGGRGAALLDTCDLSRCARARHRHRTGPGRRTSPLGSRPRSRPARSARDRGSADLRPPTSRGSHRGDSRGRSRPASRCSRRQRDGWSSRGRRTTRTTPSRRS